MAAIKNPSLRRQSIKFKDLETRDDGLDLVDTALVGAASQSSVAPASLLSRIGQTCQQRAPKFMLHKTLRPYFEENGLLNNLPGDVSAGLIVAGMHGASAIVCPVHFGLISRVLQSF